jgi:RP/EB family microtubule-associated protein
MLTLGNLPMSRVKFDARMEYEYLDNFKILQKSFKTNGVDKVSFVINLRGLPFQDGTYGREKRSPY